MRILGIKSVTETWQHFLLSPSGGAWRNDEIIRLDDTNREAALAAVRAAKHADYSLLVFAGRGEIRRGDLPWPEAHILLGDGGPLSETELNSGTPRCTIIFDWSNSTKTGPTPPSQDVGHDNAQFRSQFDQALQRAEAGLAKIYASEAEGGDAQGPSFSALLLHAAEAWAKTNHGILPLPQAVSLVVEPVPKSNPRLKAEYQGGRRLHHFPLVVSI